MLRPAARLFHPAAALPLGGLAVAPAAAAAGCLRLHGVQGPTVRQTTFICADDTLLGLSQWIGSLFCPALEASRWTLETSSALYCYIVLYCVV